MKRTVYLLIVTCFLLVCTNVFLLVLLFRQQSQNSRPKENQRVEIPQTVHVPEPQDTASQSGVAIPKSASIAAPGVDSKIRTFDIEANQGKFSPERLVVYKNDIIRINFSSTDGEYDMTFADLSISQLAKPGITKLVEFQAVTTGTFPFTCMTCREASGSAFERQNTVPNGVLLVVEKT